MNVQRRDQERCRSTSVLHVSTPNIDASVLLYVVSSIRNSQQIARVGRVSERPLQQRTSHARRHQTTRHLQTLVDFFKKALSVASLERSLGGALLLQRSSRTCCEALQVGAAHGLYPPFPVQAFTFNVACCREPSQHLLYWHKCECPRVDAGGIVRCHQCGAGGRVQRCVARSADDGATMPCIP